MENQNIISDDIHKIIKITQINSLVISGGGMKGFLYMGVIKLLFEYKLLNNIKYYYGTSFGGIICTCLILGWNIDEFIRFSKNFPIDKILDFNIDTFVENYGLVPQINAETLYKKIISFKGFNPDITFADLYKSTNKELNLITFNLKTNKSVLLNHLNTPDLMIWKALYMTSALPILMPPFETPDGIFIDGGIAENFPVNRVRPENINKMIGICAQSYIPEWSDLIDKITNKDFINYMKYNLELIKILFAKTRSLNDSSYFKVVFESNSHNNSLNFSMSGDERLKVIDIGYYQAKTQLESNINKIFKAQISEHKDSTKSFSKYHEI